MGSRLPFVVRTRPRRLGWALAALAVVAGCKHHQRTSMRPVYVGPAPVRLGAPAGCASGDCGSAAPMPVPAPASGVPEAGSMLSPPAPAGVPDASPAGGEPPLNQTTPGAAGAPPLTPPNGASTPPGDLGRRATPSARQASLRRKLQAYVNDPDDLFQPPKADRSWRYVVLHHSAHAEGSYAQIDRDHRQKLGTAGCGYHFVIGNGTESPDGQIEVARRWSEQKAGAHCRDGRTPEVNDYGIGICLVGDLDKRPPTPRQVESARALVAYLRDRYAIPANQVGTHAHLAQTRTACPGKNFPVESILGPRGLTAAR